MSPTQESAAEVPPGKVALNAYVGGLAALAVALVGAWIYRHGVIMEPPLIVGAATFAVLLLLANAFPLQVSERCEITCVDIVVIASIVSLGPFWAGVASLPCALLVGKTDWLRSAYEVARRTTEVFVAGMVFYTVSGPLLVEGAASSTATVAYATMASAVVLQGTNTLLHAGLLKAKYGQPLSTTWRESTEPYLLSDLLNVATAGAGVLALLAYGPVAAIVVVAGSVASQVMVYRSREQVRENRELRERVGSLEQALTSFDLSFGMMIVEELGRRDGYTHRHAAATAVYAEDLAREMRLDDTTVRRLRIAGLLHNVGLFSLPEELVSSTGKLNSIAQDQLAQHPIRGERALAAVPEFREMASWVRWHHERLDGRGYPDKLRGPWIPIEARILATAQAYAALVLDDPRHPAINPDEARRVLVAGIDTEFDGTVVRAFLRLLDTETEGYRVADDHRFVLPTPGDDSNPVPDVPPAAVGDIGGSEQLRR